MLEQLVFLTRDLAMSELPRTTELIKTRRPSSRSRSCPTALIGGASTISSIVVNLRSNRFSLSAEC